MMIFNENKVAIEKVVSLQGHLLDINILNLRPWTSVVVSHG